MAGDANLCAVREGLRRDNTAAVLRKVHPMAAVCDICGKKPSFGMNVSHSHRRTKRRWDPNIQRVRAVVNGAPKRLHVCTSCIRAGKVTKPLRRTHAPAATN
jgi:large subunit ribosomal protein L28